MFRPTRTRAFIHEEGPPCRVQNQALWCLYLLSPSLDEETSDVDTQWHYKDEKNGKRLGPVARDDVERLIGEDRIERSTLVWNPAMPAWARASTTELVGLFGDRPPPMPASEINRAAIYVLAFVPLLGSIVEVVASHYLADRVQLTPAELQSHWGWIGFYLVVNGIFGELDEHYLERAGLKIRGAVVLSAILAPVYIFMSCRTVARHADRRGWLAYTPFLLWFAALIGGAFVTADLPELLA